MKKISRLFAAILAAGMLASFAGCQNGSSDQTATTEKVTIPNDSVLYLCRGVGQNH